jgi:hypothetical protein
VEPVQGHVGGVDVLVLEPRPLHLKLDLSSGIVAVFDTFQGDVVVPEDQDGLRRSGCVCLPKAFDYYLGLLA